MDERHGLVRFGSGAEVRSAAGNHSSLVSETESALIAGAANTTAGNIATHAMSQENNQWLKNCIGLGDGKLAIPAAIKLVSPA